MVRIVKEEEHSARRNEILDAALQLVYSKGYDKMTIQDILDQLQISKGAFYHYFDSKTDVLESLVERMAAEQVEPVFLSIVQDPSLTALEKLHRYFETSTRWKSSRKAFFVELVKVWYSDENIVAREKMLARSAQHLEPFFTAIVKQGVREGVFTTPYPEIAGKIMINLIYDLANDSSQMFISKDAQQSSALQQLEALFAAYSDVLERILGAPTGSIHPLDTEALRAWFSSDGMLASLVEEAGIPGSSNP
ncbi:MAG TPA: TetR/AcrR family transcriptional regulator [Anaerolineales bacterium]|nr:TetR/AcrR family transcriptional regulator [Anaerolineales bacterium]